MFFSDVTVDKSFGCVPLAGPPRGRKDRGDRPHQGNEHEVGTQRVGVGPEDPVLGNDPSAGSPTETLLRLLLPLNDQVCTTFRLWVVVADLPEPVRRPH